MKRVFLAILIALLLAAGLVAGIQYDPGYILIAFGDYTLETSFWVGVLAYLLLVGGGFGLLALLSRSLRAGGAVGRLVMHRRQRRSQRKTIQGLIAFIEGNMAKARRLLLAGAESTEAPLLNYLMAARASHNLGDEQQTRRYLSRAERSTSGASIAVELTQAELLLDSGNLEESLATLTRARRNAARHPTVLKLLKAVYVGLRDWKNLMALLPELEKHRLFSEPELQSLYLEAALGQLSDIVDRQPEDKRRDELRQWWQNLPREVSRNSVVVAHYVEALMSAGDHAGAEKELRRQLRREWQRRLVELYGLVEGPDAGKQLLIAEGWLRERNNDAALLLTLGRLCLRNQLWGKAREYFEGSYRLERRPEVCAELGRLLAQLDEPEKSNAYFQEGLALSTALPSALPLPKRGRHLASAQHPAPS